MSEDPSAAALAARLRRLYGRLDAGPEFAPRLAARIAALRAPLDERTRAALRAAAEAERRAVEAALRSQLWHAVGLAAVIGGCVLLLGGTALPPLLARIGHADLRAVALVSCAALAAGVGYVLQQARRDPARILSFA